jgi:hypothetical protein
MEHLMRVALGATTDEEVAGVYEVPLWSPPGTEETIFRVPPPLVERLAAMSQADLSDCGDRWNAAFGGNLKEDYLGPLAELARKATAEGRQVFMWMSP